MDKVMYKPTQMCNRRKHKFLALQCSKLNISSEFLPLDLLQLAPDASNPVQDELSYHEGLSLSLSFCLNHQIVLIILQMLHLPQHLLSNGIL